ncbi:malto-oligosyltrehalose trehalohydrolase [soil metagenome]
MAASPTSYPYTSYPYGALLQADGIRFHVWAPEASRVEVVLEPDGRALEMTAVGDGHFELLTDRAGVGSLYTYRPDGGPSFPDPASRYQPQGVHGPSQVVDPAAYAWQITDWPGLELKEHVYYELHVGTFTPEGSFDAARRKLPYLKELGVSVVELMPVADFPGERNWGYDPSALYAPSRAYGTPEDLKRLIDEAHGLGLAVFLDVIYNHFGPDGAYAVALSPLFFTDRYKTPWGQAINLDGEGGDSVQSFFLENALYWLRDFRFDGLRLDATFALYDENEPHFLAKLSDTVAVLPGPRRHLVAEDHRNLAKVFRPTSEGGYGMDGGWADDFHHQIRSILAGDNASYFRDFTDSTEELAATLRQGWFYTGQHSEHKGGPRGSDPAGLPYESFVFCIQNHDQVGNRPQGTRLGDDVSLDAYRAATAVLLFAPETPLLFMGQEWAATSPFIFFTDHNEELGRLVSEGRKEEFRDFPDFTGDVPDPQDPQSFEGSKLDWTELKRTPHREMLDYYRDLLALRPRLGGDFTVESPVQGCLVMTRGRHVLLVALRDGVTLELPPRARVVWHSEEDRYTGEPAAPEIAGGKVAFARPAAALAELES